MSAAKFTEFLTLGLIGFIFILKYEIIQISAPKEMKLRLHSFYRLYFKNIDLAQTGFEDETFF